MRETEPVTSAPDKVAKSLDTDGTKSVKLPVQQRCWDRWQERLEQCLASIANRYPNAFARAPRLKTWMQAPCIRASRCVYVRLSATNR